MQFAIDLTRKTWVTDKFLEELTREQLDLLSAYDKATFKMTDASVAQKLGDRPWSSQERVAVNKFVNDKKKFEPKVGGYQEQVYCKNAVLQHTKTGTIIQTGGSSYEFNHQAFPQPTAGVVFKEIVVIFLCHTYAIKDGKLETVGNLFSMIPDHQLPVQPELLENVTTIWKGMINTVKGVSNKTYAQQEYDTLVQEVLRRSTMEDRISLEHHICLYFKMKKVLERINDKKVLAVWDPSVVFRQLCPDEKDVTPSAVACRHVMKALKVSAVMAFKAFPVFKIKYMTTNVTLEKITKLMQNYGSDMGGPKSAVNVTFANRSFVGRMSLRTRQMTVLMSVLEALVHSNPGKTVYFEAEVGQIPILCETIKERKIQNVKMTIAAKYLATFSKYEQYFTTNQDVLANGITVAMHFAPLPGPKKEVNQALHYAKELTAFMSSDVFIGQCLSDVAFKERNVINWFSNQYGYSVSVKKHIKISSRWTPEGREDLGAAMQYGQYLERVAASMKLSYETVYGPVYTPEKNMWSTILMGPTKGITLNFNEDEGYSIVSIVDEVDNTEGDRRDEFEIKTSFDAKPLELGHPGGPQPSDKKPIVAPKEEKPVSKPAANAKQEQLDILISRLSTSMKREHISLDDDNYNDEIGRTNFINVTPQAYRAVLEGDDFEETCGLIEMYYIHSADCLEKLPGVPICIRPVSEFFLSDVEWKKRALGDVMGTIRASSTYETTVGDV